MPTPTAVEAAQQARQDLINSEASSINRLTRVYARIYNGLSDQLQQIAETIADAPSIDKARRYSAIRNLLREIEDRIGGVIPLIENEIALQQEDALSLGVQSAVDVITASLPDLPPGVVQAIVSELVVLPTDAVQEAAALFGGDSPLIVGLTADYGEEVAERVANQILLGIAAGMNPRRVARLLETNLQRALGTSLNDALRLVRTSQLYSYRLATQANYTANNNLVKEWVWWSALDSRTCRSCIAQHGNTYPVTDILRDHWNGRCVPVPQTVSYADLGINAPDRRRPIETGEAWFRTQNRATQISILGPAAWRAWQANDVSFEDFTKRTDDPVFGEMFVAASLKGILGDRAKRFYKEA